MTIAAFLAGIAIGAGLAVGFLFLWLMPKD